MPDDISDILSSYHANALWEMAREAGLEVVDRKGKRLPKAQVMAAMSARFFARERVLASLAKLQAHERAVLNRLLLRGGTAPSRTLRREVLRAGLVTDREADKRRTRYSQGAPYSDDAYVGDPTRAKSTEFADVIARLTYHGLVFSRTTALTGGTPYKLQFHPGNEVYVPPPVRRHLPEPAPLPVASSTWQPEQVRPGDPHLLLRDLYLYWDYVRRHDVPLLQNSLVGKRSLRAVNALLLAPDPLLDQARTEGETGRLYLLRLLLEKLDLVRRHSGQLRPAVADPLGIPESWDWPLHRQLQACLAAWSGLDATALPLDLDPQGCHPARARALILDVLRARPAGAWLDRDEFVEQVMDRDADFLFTHHTYVATHRGKYLYQRSGLSGPRDDILRRFEQAERRFLDEAVLGFLPQLGLVDLGYVGGQWGALRVTSLGEALLAGETASLPAQDAGKLLVQPNFQVLALGPVSLAWLAWLDLFADREQADRGAFTYRLSRDSLYRAQQAGMDVPDVVRFLAEKGGVDLPQNVQRSLHEWGAHHERIVFRRGVSLLQAADPGLLDSLMDDPHTGVHLARALSPVVAIVQKGTEEELSAALVGRGLFPAVSGAEPEAADHSVIVQEDGSIRAVHAVPNLHLRARLDALAEATGEGRWQLTERSVRRAGGSKAKVLRLLEELGRLHRGSLPAALERQIKAWGGYYGAAAAETLTLIQFRDSETLDELCQQPELRPYLAPFPAGGRALAAVPAGKLAEAIDILARFGVATREGLPG